MTPVGEIEFLGMIVNLKEMTIFLLQKKLQSIKQMCQDLYQNPVTTVLELTKALGHLTSTILAILPAKKDPYSVATNAFSIINNYAFPPFCLITGSEQNKKGQDKKLILIAPCW